MKSKVDKVLDAWFDKYGKNGSVYPDERIAEIATNCVSLSSVWLERIKKFKNASLEVVLFNKEGVACETLHGVSVDNLPDTMLDILVNSNQKYSKMAINYYMFNGNTKVSDTIGELEIS